MTDTYTDSPVISARGLVREYAPDRGVCGVDLDVHPGECFALLGRNGSGKSTLTRLLIAEEAPDAGTLTVNGRDLTALGSRERLEHLRSLGIAMDTSIHWSKLSGTDNAWFVASAYGLDADGTGKQLSELLPIANLVEQADDPVADYSYGMRRKLSIVEAITHRPELLVLDEPTSGVDVHFSAALAELIQARSAEERATWVASNDPEWVAEVATRVAFMDRGRIVSIGTVRELLAEIAPYQEIQVELTKPEAIPAPNEAGVQSFTQTDTHLVIVADEDPMLVPKLMEWVIGCGGILESVQVKQPTLRDAFLLKTGKDLQP
jgi:ABC-2 type transport system ATP-binding protein